MSLRLYRRAFQTSVTPITSRVLFMLITWPRQIRCTLHNFFFFFFWAASEALSTNYETNQKIFPVETRSSVSWVWWTNGSSSYCLVPELLKDRFLLLPWSDIDILQDSDAPKKRQTCRRNGSHDCSWSKYIWRGRSYRQWTQWLIKNLMDYPLSIISSGFLPKPDQH